MAVERRGNTSETWFGHDVPMATSGDDTGPEIGLTGARFGGAPRRRRKKVDPFAGQAPRTTAPPPVPEDPIGRTGARFGGIARPRRAADPAPAPAAPAAAAQSPVPQSPVAQSPVPQAPAPGRWAGPEPEWAGPADPPPYRLVRPYVLTGGRTRAGVEFAVEALLTARPGPPRPGEPAEGARIRALCREPRSVAEVAALTGLPLGVARVLLADMHAAGAIAVHRTADAGGPDDALLERVLAGLRRL